MANFESTCYHPLLLFNREGDCLAAKLAAGNGHSAEDWGRIAADALKVVLADGRIVSVPLAWFPRLLDATAKQRRAGN